MILKSFLVQHCWLLAAGVDGLYTNETSFLGLYALSPLRLFAPSPLRLFALSPLRLFFSTRHVMLQLA